MQGVDFGSFKRTTGSLGKVEAGVEASGLTSYVGSVVGEVVAFPLGDNCFHPGESADEEERTGQEKKKKRQAGRTSWSSGSGDIVYEMVTGSGSG